MVPGWRYARSHNAHLFCNIDRYSTSKFNSFGFGSGFAVPIYHFLWHDLRWDAFLSFFQSLQVIVYFLTCFHVNLWDDDIVWYPINLILSTRDIYRAFFPTVCSALLVCMLYDPACTDTDNSTIPYELLQLLMSLGWYFPFQFREVLLWCQCGRTIFLAYVQTRETLFCFVNIVNNKIMYAH